MVEENKLRGLRSARRLTQEDMAKVLGITKKSYLMKEKGNWEFRKTEIEKLMSFFNLKYEDIFTPFDYTKSKKIE